MEGQSINTKKSAAAKAITFIKDGMTIGLGTGSTAYWAIQSIGDLVKNGLQLKAVATSLHSEKMARELGVQIISFGDVDKLDVTIDGADEVDEKLNLIKGGGGALLREKIVAAATELYIIVADETKLVNTLGTFPLPVEVVLFGWEMSVRQLKKLGCTAKIRMADDAAFISDNDNYIVDCSFGSITEPDRLQQEINAIPGVVDNGLFLHMADLVILGNADGSTTMLGGE
ncbi:MAG: ribose-5-phosphate isomerase RpiA [Chitinophagaceae bacterium]